MPEPINNAHTPWSSAAEHTARLEPEQLRGPSARELTAQHRGQVLREGVSGLIASGVKQLLGEYAAMIGNGTAAVAAAVTGPGATLHELVKGYASEMQAADQLNEAHRRDAVHLAVTWLAAPALPRDFVENRQELYRDVGHDPSLTGTPANRLLSRIAFEGRYDEAKNLAQQQASSGRSAAHRLGIDSQEALEQCLRESPEFAAQYENPVNIAFRLGVDSVVWQAQHPAAPQQTEG